MKTSDYYEHHAPDRKVGVKENRSDYMGGGLYEYRFNLPTKFTLNRQGGWISPSNRFFPLRQNESADFVLKNDANLQVPFGYTSASLYAFEKGWILQNYDQIYGYEMDLRRTSNQQRKVTFTATLTTFQRDLFRRRVLAVADYFFDVFGVGNITFTASLAVISGEGWEKDFTLVPLGRYGKPIFLDNRLDRLRLSDMRSDPAGPPAQLPAQPSVTEDGK